MGKWRPIETAPRDGTEILVVDEDREVLIAGWSTVLSKWADAFCDDVEAGNASKLTHWMPLPDPPET